MPRAGGQARLWLFVNGIRVIIYGTKRKRLSEMTFLTGDVFALLGDVTGPQHCFCLALQPDG